MFGLEIVRCSDHGDFVTVQVALDGRLAVPMTVDRATWKGTFATDTLREQWLARSARTLLDIYGDAREDRRLSDRQVLELTRQ